MSSLCYVPNCDSENSDDKDRLLFSAPSEADIRRQWTKAIPKGARPFNPDKDEVCIKHFEDRFIVKEETAVICGVKEVFPLDTWILSSDAVPTIFGDTSISVPSPGVSSKSDPYSNRASPLTPAVLSDSDDDLGAQNNDASAEVGDAETFDDLIVFNSPKRKATEHAKPGPKSKKSRPGPLSSKVEVSILDDSNDIVILPSVDSPATVGRPAHLKREIIPPSRIRDDSYSEDVEYVLNDLPSSPDTADSWSTKKKRRGRPKGSKSTPGYKPKNNKQPPIEPIRIKIPPASSYKKTPVNNCSVQFCERNPNSATFKIPHMSKAKLRDWMKHIPPIALAKPFDSKTDYLCEDHFDKKFIMLTPQGKILTGDAIPSIFPTVPKLVRSYGGAKKRGRKPGPKSRVEVVDGYEIEYEGDSDDKNQPITVVLDDDDDEYIEVKNKGGTKKNSSVPAPPKPKPSRILEIKDPGYNLQYIYDMRDKIQLPQAEVWLFQMMVDKETKTKCIFISEVVSRLERLIFRRNIRIKADLTFKVEANGLDFSQMFNETGNKVDSLYKLQEMILDLSAFKVCEGWSQFENLDPNPTGRKIEGIWFALNCEGLNLNNSRCRPCLALKASLITRKNGLSLNSSDPAVIQQIRKLPKEDPLFLQLQIQDLLKEKTKLKFELSTVEKRESRLQDKIKMLEAGMKVKGKTVVVSPPSSSSSTPVNSSGPPKPVSNSVPKARPSRPRAPVPLTSPSAPTTFNVQHSLNNSPRPLPPPLPQIPPTVRKPTPILLSSPPGSTTNNSSFNTTHSINNMMQNVSQGYAMYSQQQNLMGGGGGAYGQNSYLTPTFVLAQGSGHEIGHQTIETSTQVLPAVNLGHATLPGINVTLQKQGDHSGNSSTDELTLLSL